MKKITCKLCNRSFKGGPNAKYCSVCREERRREADKEYRIRKRKGLTREIGSEDKCVKCGDTYIVEGGLQQFCPNCQQLHKLEVDRVRSREYYDLNKDEIKPKMKEMRRVGARICEVCGKEYNSPTNTLTCSTECRRIRANRNWKKNYHKRKKEKATHQQ